MKGAVRANFDASVEAYEAYERETGRFTELTRSLLAEMTEHAERYPGRILDAGAGTGVSTSVLARAGTTVALDTSREMLRANGTSRRVQGDFDRLPFASDSFDAVAFTASLFLVPEPAVAVAEARRVLRPGGVVGAVAPGGWETPDGDDPFRELGRESRSPVSAAAVREAIAAGFETTTGSWRFRTTAGEVRLFHEIPAMAARLFPDEPPTSRVRKARAVLDPLAGPLAHRWEWTLGRWPSGATDRD
ncbi:MAG: class I SAM-dependent methyltransferase [Haloarculaceae archaeon]